MMSSPHLSTSSIVEVGKRIIKSGLHLWALLYVAPILLQSTVHEENKQFRAVSFVVLTVIVFGGLMPLFTIPTPRKLAQSPIRK